MSRRTSIRIPDDLYTQLDARAEDEGRTVSNLIIVLLYRALRAEKTTPQSTPGAKVTRGVSEETPRTDA